MPSAVKYEGEYSSELSRTTRPTFREVKWVRTFLKGVGISLHLDSSDSDFGNRAYSGDVTGTGATGACCGDAKARNSGHNQLKSPMSTLSNFSYLHLLSVLRAKQAVI